jgi:hypothetical protein
MVTEEERKEKIKKAFFEYGVKLRKLLQAAN